MKAETVFEQMRRDHRRVLERVAELETGTRGNGSPRGRLPAAHREEMMRGVVSLLKRQFRTHMAAEDEVLFPALLAALPQARATLEPLRAEHAELRSMLQRLDGTLGEPRGRSHDEQVAIQVRDLADLLRIHIRKEEAVALSVAERVLHSHEIEAIESRMRSGIRWNPEPSAAGTTTKGTLP